MQSTELAGHDVSNCFWQLFLFSPFPSTPIVNENKTVQWLWRVVFASLQFDNFTFSVRWQSFCSPFGEARQIFLKSLFMTQSSFQRGIDSLSHNSISIFMNNQTFFFALLVMNKKKCIDVFLFCNKQAIVTWDSGQLKWLDLLCLPHFIILAPSGIISQHNQKAHELFPFKKAT